MYPSDLKVEYSQPFLQEESSKITTQATGAINWRRADVRYKKNEAFVDVIENVNLNMSAKGEFVKLSTPDTLHLRILQATSCARMWTDISRCAPTFQERQNASLG